jgi:hypothetical protein
MKGDHIVGLLLDIEVLALAVPLLGIVVPHAERVDVITRAEGFDLRTPNAIVVDRAVHEDKRRAGAAFDVGEVIAVDVHRLHARR